MLQFCVWIILLSQEWYEINYNVLMLQFCVCIILLSQEWYEINYNDLMLQFCVCIILLSQEWYEINYNVLMLQFCVCIILLSQDWYEINYNVLMLQFCVCIILLSQEWYEINYNVLMSSALCLYHITVAGCWSGDIQSLYSWLSLFRPRLYRITAYLEVKVLSLPKHENLTTGEKYCGKGLLDMSDLQNWGKIIRITTFNKFICNWTLEVGDIVKILWKRGEISPKEPISHLFHNIFTCC